MCYSVWGRRVRHDLPAKNSNKIDNNMDKSQGEKLLNEKGKWQKNSMYNISKFFKAEKKLMGRSRSLNARLIDISVGSEN